MSGNAYDARGMYFHSQRKYGATLKGESLTSLKVVQGTLQGTLLWKGTPAYYSSKECSTATSGLYRNCGWTVREVGTCSPDTQVRVAAADSCTTTAPLGSSSGDTMLRVCHGESGCDYGYGGLIAHNDDSCGLEPSVSFSCPSSGKFTVMTAPYYSGDYKTSSSPSAAYATYPAYKILKGEDLLGAEILADEFLPDGTTGMTGIKYRITSIDPETEPLPPGYPYAVGTTLLYGLEHQTQEGQWVTTCAADADGRSVAIPTDGTWNYLGQKVWSRTYFTFACTSGVMGKCYRWGYRPWEGTATPSMWDGHQACTRMARADYCGDGYSWTKDGTTVNMWDTFSPGAVSTWESDPAYNEDNGFYFEAGWDHDGARCLSHYRWYDLPEGFAKDRCPDRLRDPDYVPPPDSKEQLGPTVCDSQKEAEAQWPTYVYDKSQCNGVDGGCKALEGSW